MPIPRFSVRGLAPATLFLLLLMLLPGPIHGQTSRRDPTDLQGRYGTALTLDFPDGWEASLKAQIRTVDNASAYRGSYLTWEGSHQTTDWLNLQGSYRLARVEDGTYHRLGGGVESRYDLGPIRLTLRTILQYQKQTFEYDDSDADTLLRTRLRARYRFEGGHDLYASVEPYFSFNEDYPIDNWRNTVGFRYAITPEVRIDVFYIYRPDYAKSYNRVFHVIGVDLEFTKKLDW